MRLRKKAVGLIERIVLGVGMSVIAFAVERQLTAALRRKQAVQPKRRGRLVKIGMRRGA